MRKLVVSIISILLVASVVVTFTWFIKSREMVGMEEVTFCGIIYKVKPVFVGGIDVLRRIAQIEAIAKYPAVQCGSLMKISQNGVLPVKLEECKGYTSKYPNMNHRQCLSFEGGVFIFDPTLRKIYLPGFDGSDFYGDFE